jgi:hypothetical protein
MFNLSMFGPFRCSVLFDVQSFDVRSHSRFGLSTFSLSTFGPIRHSVFRCSVPFEVRSFDVRSFRCSVFRGSVFRRSVFRGSVFRGLVIRGSVTVFPFHLSLCPYPPVPLPLSTGPSGIPLCLCLQYILLPHLPIHLFSCIYLSLFLSPPDPLPLFNYPSSLAICPFVLIQQTFYFYSPVFLPVSICPFAPIHQNLYSISWPPTPTYFPTNSPLIYLCITHTSALSLSLCRYPTAPLPYPSVSLPVSTCTSSSLQQALCPYPLNHLLLFICPSLLIHQNLCSFSPGHLTQPTRYSCKNVLPNTALEYLYYPLICSKLVPLSLTMVPVTCLCKLSPLFVLI